MIPPFRTHTYREVAGRLAEGLRSGDVLLDRDEAREELASFAWFALNFAHPKTMSYVASPALAPGISPVTDRGAVRVVIGVEDFESLPPEVRSQLLEQSEELRRKGLRVEMTDPEGRPLHPGNLQPVA